MTVDFFVRSRGEKANWKPPYNARALSIILQYEKACTQAQRVSFDIRANRILKRPRARSPDLRYIVFHRTLAYTHLHRSEGDVTYRTLTKLIHKQRRTRIYIVVVLYIPGKHLLTVVLAFLQVAAVKYLLYVYMYVWNSNYYRRARRVMIEISEAPARIWIMTLNNSVRGIVCYIYTALMFIFDTNMCVCACARARACVCVC